MSTSNREAVSLCYTDSFTIVAQGLLIALTGGTTDGTATEIAKEVAMRRLGRCAPSLPLLLVAGAVLGAPPFDALDADGDGRITRAEAEADPRVSEQFDDIDTNLDGTLDEAEYARWRASQNDTNQ